MPDIVTWAAVGVWAFALATAVLFVKVTYPKFPEDD